MQTHSLPLLALVLGAAACSSPPAEPAPAPPPPPALRATSFGLPTGLEVELLAGPCGDQLAIALLRPAGTDHDPPGRSGMARLAGRIAAAAQPAREVSVGRDHTLELFVVPGSRLGETLEAIAAGSEPLRPDPERLGAARAGLLADLAEQRGGIAERTARSFAAEAVLQSRGGGWIGGVAEQIEAITEEDLAAFWRASHAPAGARLVVVGDLEPAQTRRRIEGAFAALPAVEPAPAREALEARVSGTLVMGEAPAALSLAVRAPALGDPLFPAFLVLATRLGQTEVGVDVAYDPVEAPEVLFVAGALAAGETPDGAADRVRRAVDQAVRGAITAADVTAARERHRLLLGLGALDPASCRPSPRDLARARALRSPLGWSGPSLSEALDTITEAQASDARALFSPGRTAAVVAGGAIR